MTSRLTVTGILAAGLAAAAAAPATPATGAVISNSDIVFGTDPAVGPWANYAATVGGGTEVGFAYTAATLAVTVWELNEGSDWYLANPGDVFSATTIAANQFPVIFSEVPHYYVSNTVSIPLGEFYLGVNTGGGYTNGQPHRDVFGWLELYNDGTQLIPIANAVDYGDGGIIVGTTTPIPEPASLMLLGAALPLLAKRRRRRA